MNPSIFKFFIDLWFFDFLFFNFHIPYIFLLLSERFTTLVIMDVFFLGLNLGNYWDNRNNLYNFTVGEKSFKIDSNAIYSTFAKKGMKTSGKCILNKDDNIHKKLFAACWYHRKKMFLFEICDTIYIIC